ncbi:MAG: hypothetical protein JSR41_18150 [Proteobacteria bacterium]|nr:hypothetical protein [Pseudomonadota bacterium]
MTLEYLVFDYSEGDDDTGLFDALAVVAPERAAAVQAEIDAVLDWAARFPGPRGPVEEGGAWEADLLVSDDRGTTPRRSFTLSIGGVAAFCEAFRERFGDAVV